jgi:hypothetical protein
MSALESGIGVAESGKWSASLYHFRPSLRSNLRPDFTHYDYPGIYMDQNFHHCGLEPNDTIVDYDNKAEVWTCELDGLAE